MIKSEKTRTESMFETNIKRFGGSWFSVTHPHSHIKGFKENVDLKRKLMEA